MAVQVPRWELWEPGEDQVGEGPVWRAGTGTLHRVDIPQGLLWRTGPTGPFRQRIGQPVGAAVPTASDGWVLAARDGFALLTAEQADDPAPVPEWIAPVLRDRPDERFNDAEVDHHGRVWAGSMTIDPQPGRGRLWVLDPDGTARVVASGLTLPNGLDFSPDDRVLHLADSAAHCVYRYALDPIGPTVLSRTVVARIPPEHGMPDGLTIDAEGFLWVALWGGQRVVRLDPDGAEVLSLPLPVTQVSSCTFGGPDLRDLYVTSARRDLPAAASVEPLAGSVFRFPCVGQGRPARTFG